MATLLPLNSTPLELAIEAASVEDTAILLRTLYNPDTCPVALLPHLAWAWSVDRWDRNWSESIKRQVIRSAFYVHAHKGTIGALRRLVEPFGYLIEIDEWWELEPLGVPGTFSLRVGVSDKGIDEQTYLELSRLIDDARPVSRPMIGLDISLETRVPAYTAAFVADGDVLEVYPWEVGDIEVRVGAHNLLTDHTNDILDVYLNG